MTISRDSLLPLSDYEARRDSIRAGVLAAKRPRRVHVGDHLTFLFENDVTMRDQVMEMIRIEHLTDEADIQHELDTYNAVLGGAGELGVTLLIEIPDAEERARKLARWTGLPETVYVELADGLRVRPRYDRGQVGDDRLSSVQYLKFDTHGQVPVAIGTDHPELSARVELSDDTKVALSNDLRSAR